MAVELAERPWGTPTSRDWKDGSSVANVPENGLLGRQAVNRSNEPGAKLHGSWTLALMGYPPDWCDDLPPDPMTSATDGQTAVGKTDSPAS